MIIRLGYIAFHNNSGRGGGRGESLGGWRSRWHSPPLAPQFSTPCPHLLHHGEQHSFTDMLIYLFVDLLIVFHLFFYLILCSFMCFKYRHCIHVFLLFSFTFFFFYGPLVCWHVTSVRKLYFWHKICIMPLSCPSPSLSFMCTVFQPEILTLFFFCNLFSAWAKYCTVLFIHTSFPTWWHSLVFIVSHDSHFIRDSH